MKKFIAGVFVGLLISFSTIAFANSPIKLIVDDKEIKCDVPPQIINGRTLVPARFLAEALGAQKVEWDQDKNAVLIYTYNKEYLSLPKFTKGISIRNDPTGGVIVKVNRDELPTDMKKFTNIMVSALDEPSPKLIALTLEDHIITKRYLEYDSINGFSEGFETPYYVVMLFDNNGNLLGYQVVEKPK
ncbi:MAG: copper amine oxidase N-terminal domain-containing protein [Peptococcaceae bacterium]|nr:copper amine oxidase N-terminal domain-containing protein [Peptococcaceae bacterium]